MKLWAAGSVSFSEYLDMERRYVELRLEVAKWDSDRIRFLEEEVAAFKRIEMRAQASYRAGQAMQVELTRCELARLDLEYALAKLKAKANVVK